MVTTIAYTKHLFLLVSVLWVLVFADLMLLMFLWWYFCDVVYTVIDILFLYYDRFHMFFFAYPMLPVSLIGHIALSVFSNIFFFFFEKKCRVKMVSHICSSPHNTKNNWLFRTLLMLNKKKLASVFLVQTNFTVSDLL